MPHIGVIATSRVSPDETMGRMIDRKDVDDSSFLEEAQPRSRDRYSQASLPKFDHYSMTCSLRSPSTKTGIVLSRVYFVVLTQERERRISVNHIAIQNIDPKALVCPRSKPVKGKGDILVEKL